MHGKIKNTQMGGGKFGISRLLLYLKSAVVASNFSRG